MAWSNRIVRTGTAVAIEFMANPNNWRIHPSFQQEALEGVLGDVGWVAPVVVNVRTGNLIDGHMRVMLALKRGDETPIPFVEVDLSEDEERKILATFDPIGDMAAVDREKFHELLGAVDTENAALSSLLHDMRYESLPIEQPEGDAEVGAAAPGADDASDAANEDQHTCPRCGHRF